MYHILLVLFLSLSFLFAHCQVKSSRGEFATSTNGLMYSENDIRSLRFIVDSLNLRFKTCELNKTYYSHPQVPSYHIVFKSKSNNLKNIIADIKDNISYHRLAEKYSTLITSIDSFSLLIKLNDDYFLSGNPAEGYDHIDIPKRETPDYSDKKNKWTYKYLTKNSYELNCRFYPAEWQQRSIPEKYAKLIQYVDCMIDTSASVFLTEKYSGGWYNEDETNVYYNLEKLADYLDVKMFEKENNNKQLKQLNELQITFAVKELRNDAVFRDLLVKTIDDYVKNKTPDHQLESLASQMDIYDKALLMKRCYRIMGSCSQDSRPREHARDIAILAAQAHSWDIFLRAHLDIMNDRFERASDGSYAWNERKTYLKELEELNLNIVDLMLGLTLRAQNIANNHYYGTIWRMGWALTESNEKNVFEEKAIAMIKDNSLDEFNRGLVFLLYKTYISYLDEPESEQKRKTLKETVTSFPLFIQTSIKKMDEPKDRRRR